VAVVRRGPGLEGSSPEAPVPSDQRSKPRWGPQLGLAAGMIVVRIVVLVAVLRSPAANQFDKAIAYDAARYHEIAHSSGVPYRDYEVEFPPVALGLIETVSAGSIRGTEVRLGWTQLVLDLLAAGALLFGWGHRAALAYLLLGTPLLLFLYLRIDLLSVMLATWAAALVHRGKERTGAGVLAASVLSKVWPLVLVPILLVRASRRARVWFLALFAAGVVAWLAWSGPSGLHQVLTFRGARGWEGESLIGSILRIHPGNAPVFEVGSLRVGYAPLWARLLLLAFLIVIVGVLTLRARKTSVDPAGVPSATAVSSLLLLSPILSAQYVSWLLPWSAISSSTGERTIERLTLAITLLTTASIFEFEGNLVVLLARNALLLILVAVGVAGLIRPVVVRAEKPPVRPG
jgi:hypothetical protein